MGDLLDGVILELLYQNILLFIVGGLLFLATWFAQRFGLIYLLFHKVSCSWFLFFIFIL